MDDGPFVPSRETSREGNQKNFAPLIATHLRGPHLICFQAGRVTVDGLDGTREALRILRKLPKRPVLLSGVTFGGFNIIDPRHIQAKMKVPVVVVTGSRPSNQRIKRALVHHFTDWRERWSIIGSLGPLKKVKTVPGEPPLHYEPFGCPPNVAIALLRETCFVSRVPEPLRVASLVARGLAQPLV